MIRDGRPPDEWQRVDIPGNGSATLVKGLRYFDNLFDAYTVLVGSKGYEATGLMPVHISPEKPVPVDLINDVSGKVKIARKSRCPVIRLP